MPYRDKIECRTEQRPRRKEGIPIEGETWGKREALGPTIGIERLS